MNNKKRTLVMIFVLIVISLLVFNTQYTKTIEEAFSKSNISYSKILHRVDTEKGVVVFYKKSNHLHLGLIEKRLTGYKWVFGAGAEGFSSENDIEFGYSNIGKSGEKGSKDAFPLISGTLLNDEIKEVQVILRDEEPKKANIISTDSEIFWYLFLDKQINYTPEVVGIGNNGDIIYPNKKIKLESLGLPLKGENVFHPTKIKIGDKVQGLVLKDIQVFEGTNDYPIDTLVATFQGNVTLTGTIEFLEKDNEFYFENLLLFKPDSISSKKLPISHHEFFNRGITIENKVEGATMLNIKPGESRENIKIEIDNFTIRYLATDAFDSGRLIRLINE